MYSRPSIYDLLTERRPAKPSPSRETPEVLQYHTDFLFVDDAWLRCGSGDIHTIMAADSPSFFCDFIHDPRIRDQFGHYLGVSRIEGGGTTALDPRVRASQLLELTMNDLVTSRQELRLQASRVILQVPPGVAEEDWLDEVLMLWPVDKQPIHGMEVTSLPFDEWLGEELSHETGKADSLQFIAVQPLNVPTSSTVATPGEAVTCLWLRRARMDAPDSREPDDPEVDNVALKLMSPARTSHEPRHTTPRGTVHLLEAALDVLDVDTDATKAIIWDGDRSGFRLDHMINVLQQRFPHLYFDTDLWSVQGIGGSVQSASSAVQVVLATHLARQRKGDIILLDSRAEERTLALWLRCEDAPDPIPITHG